MSGWSMMPADPLGQVAAAEPDVAIGQNDARHVASARHAHEARPQHPQQACGLSISQQ
jgi:hypothetical protein